MARRLLGTSHEQDEGLSEQLINERRRRTRLDGGIEGWVVATAWSASELLQLGCPADHTGVVRMVGYLLSRQGQPGRFGEGCDPKRHERGICRHFLTGFFSPGPVDETIAPLVLPSGVRVDSEWSARFAASCFALRTVLQARQEARPSVIAHIDSLLALGRSGSWDGFTQRPVLAMFTLSALSLAPIAYRDQVHALAGGIIERQEPDGSWEGVSLFHAMDTMLNLATPEARASIRRAGHRLIDLQADDGAFDDTGDEELALVALRALKTLGSSRSTPKPPRYSSPGKRTDPRRRDRAGR